MIDIEVKLRRWFWKGISVDVVDAYLQELIETKEKLNQFSFEYSHFLFGGKLIEELIRTLNTEINYCKFYQEFTKRQKSEINFDEWIFIKMEEIEPRYSWDLPNKGEQWTKTNGRIKATIQYDRSGSMIKLMLNYQNDCENLRFLDQPEKYKITYAKKESSIAKKVEELKIKAEAFMKEHLFPRYEAIESELRDLKKLLCIS